MRNSIEDSSSEALTRIFETTRDAFEGTSTWLALADTTGTVVEEWATGDALRRYLKRSDIERGTGFAVETAGRNGIGAALTTSDMVLVVGPDHDNERLQGLTCAAITIHHPITRQLVSVLNLSTLAQETTPLLKYALQRTASDIRRALYSSAHSRQRHLFEAHMRIKSQVPALVVTLDESMLLVDGDTGLWPINRQRIWEAVERLPKFANTISFADGAQARVIPIDPASRSAGVTLIFEKIDVFGIEGAPQDPDLSGQDAGLSPIELVERDLIIKTLKLCHGNKKSAAEQLKISRGTLYERLRRYRISDV